VTDQSAVRDQFQEWLNYAMAEAAQGRGQIEYGNSWDNIEGWRTYMRVGDKAIMFSPGWGRGFARRTRKHAEAVMARMSPEKQAEIDQPTILKLFDNLEAQCKETMAMRAANVSPEDVFGPEKGTA